MARLIYIVTLQPNKTASCSYAGVWGAYPSLDKARQAVEGWITEYEEELEDMHEMPTASWHYLTDKNVWIIEGTFLEEWRATLAF